MNSLLFVTKLIDAQTSLFLYIKGVEIIDFYHATFNFMLDIRMWLMILEHSHIITDIFPKCLFYIHFDEVIHSVSNINKIICLIRKYYCLICMRHSHVNLVTFNINEFVTKIINIRKNMIFYKWLCPIERNIMIYFRVLLEIHIVDAKHLIFKAESNMENTKKLDQ